MQVICRIPGPPLWLPDDATGSFAWLYAVATDGLWRIGDYCVEVRAGGGRMGSLPVAPVNCVAFVNFLTSNIAKDKGIKAELWKWGHKNGVTWKWDQVLICDHIITDQALTSFALVYIKRQFELRDGNCFCWQNLDWRDRITVNEKIYSMRIDKIWLNF